MPRPAASRSDANGYAQDLLPSLIKERAPESLLVHGPMVTRDRAAEEQRDPASDEACMTTWPASVPTLDEDGPT